MTMNRLTVFINMMESETVLKSVCKHAGGRASPTAMGDISCASSVDHV